MVRSSHDDLPALRIRCHGRSRIGQAWQEELGVVGAGPQDEARIRVLVVSDQLLHAEALQTVLADQPQISVIGTATQLDCDLRMAATSPDLVVIEDRPPELCGVPIAQDISNRWPGVKNLLLVEDESPGLLTRALRAGCSALVAKHRPVSELVAAIERAHQGEFMVRTEDLRRLVRGVQAPERPRVAHSLSDREVTVLALLAKAQSLRAISTQLYLSPHTVRHHIQNALQKLDAHSRLEAVDIAVREGILSAEDAPLFDESRGGPPVGARRPADVRDSTVRADPGPHLRPIKGG